jgi:hypothetical protein
MSEMTKAKLSNIYEEPPPWMDKENIISCIINSIIGGILSLCKSENELPSDIDRNYLEDYIYLDLRINNPGIFMFNQRFITNYSRQIVDRVVDLIE